MRWTSFSTDFFPTARTQNRYALGTVFPAKRTQSIVEGGMQRQDGVESEEPDRPARSNPFGDHRESYGHRIGCLLGRDQNTHPDRGEKSHLGEVNDECGRGSFQRLADRATDMRCRDHVDLAADRQHHQPVPPTFANLEGVSMSGLSRLAEMFD